MSIRVAMVGLGWAAKTIWLPRLRNHPDMTVTVVADPDPDARALIAATDPDLRVLSTYRELAPDMADLVIVAVPNHAHAPVACGLLRRGMSVFLEKPVCLASAEADELADAEKAGGGILIAGSAACYRADVRALQRVVATLGRIRHVRLEWIRTRGVPGASWFTQRRTAGGGALVDLGWHLLDIGILLLGPVGFSQVLGTVEDDFVNRSWSRATWRREEQGPCAADVEDTARGFLVTTDGVSILLHASWASHAEYDSSLVEVHGSAGLAVLRCAFGFSPNRLGDSSLTLAREGRISMLSVDQEPVGAEYDRQVDALIRVLADSGQRGKAIESARRTIDAIERFYQSASRADGSPDLQRRPA